MAPTDGKRIAVSELALAILAGVEAHWAAQSSVQELPDRRYLAAGAPNLIAWDCEQLVVSLVGVGWGPAPDVAGLSPEIGAQAYATGVRHAIFSVQLVRCTPSAGNNRAGVLPPAASIHDAGVSFMDDAGMMSQALLDIAATLKQGMERGALVQPGVINPLGPEGGMHAVEGTMAITAGNLA